MRSAAYRCVATSVGGFLQQLAVAYVCRGYTFYSSFVIPPDKDPAAVDAKLVARYGVACSAWERARRKRAGIANVQYLRHDRFGVLVATKGAHRFFEDEDVRDFRRRPLYFAGYSISYRRGVDGRYHPSVRLAPRQYAIVKAAVCEAAAWRSSADVARMLAGLQVEAYAPVRRQLLNVHRAANRVLRAAGQEPVPVSCLPLRRRVLRPFD